jgi:dTDP-4-amino-4,6-dideoxygalactose transaminase
MTATTRVPFLRSEFSIDVARVVGPVLASGYVGAGRRVDALERALATYLGVENVVCTSSCTAALTLSYLAAAIRPGEIVLSTPMTCAATNIPLLHLGARIAWLDVDPITGNVTADAVLDGLRAHPSARAIIIMDWAGWPCAYDEICAIAEDAGLPVIVDAAQSFGSTLDGLRCASRAAFVCYSFGPTKIFSTVEGGAIVVRDAAVAQRLRVMRWYGIDRAARNVTAFWEYDVTTPGHRFTTNDVFAEIGVQGLPHFHRRLAHHRHLAKCYRDDLVGIAGVTLPPDDSRRVSNYWMFSILAEGRTRLLRRLHDAGIHAATPHNRNDHLTCFANTEARPLSGVDHFAANYLCLPIGPWVTEANIGEVCSIVRAGW